VRVKQRDARIYALSLRCALGLLAFAVTCFGAARAQDSDPPGRVARLSDAEGSVSLQPAGVPNWVAAEINRPVTSGDRLWSEQDSRAELDLGGAAIRLGSNTGFSFFSLDDSSAQMQLTAGTLIVHVRDLTQNQLYEIDTPNLAVTLLAPGEYRVEVNSTGDTTVIKVSEGSAQADGGGRSVVIGMQQMARISGAQTLTYEFGTLSVPDALDAWSAARERGLQQAASGEYVAQDTPGISDLDNNGNWELTPDYGYVWAPTVMAVGWAPYRFGHWAWIAPWGWTWIDDSSWGFAPYHYGRWVQWNSAWCWVPGPRRVRPVYAPALVGWVGGPGRATPAAFEGHVGWFPLGPHEVYVPAYAVSAGYLRRVNLNNTVVNSAYLTEVYQGHVTSIQSVNNTPGAVTAVPQSVFSSGVRLRGQTVGVSASTLAASTVLATAPAIAPLRQSVLGPSASPAVRRPPPAYLNRPVLARTPPPRAPAPFDRQLTAIQANGGRPLTRAELAQLQPAAAAAPVRVLPVAAMPLRLPVAARVSTPEALPDFAQREHALENSTLPSVPRQSEYRAPEPASPDTAAVTGSPVPRGTQPPTRSDRPPGAAPSAAGSPSGATPMRPTPAPKERYRTTAPAPSAPPHTAPPPANHPPPPPSAGHSSSNSVHESSASH
jgi:FecR protein